MSDPRRVLPSVDRLLSTPAVQSLMSRVPRNVVVTVTRELLAVVRSGHLPVPEDWAAEITDGVADRIAPSLVPVLNATGVVLHTNLGRAPLARAALDAVARIGGGYSNLELDLATGTRGSRLDHCASLLAELTGAAGAMIVNNAAGALVLALNTIAAGREVIISRGELVEIGGSFRIPDILEKSGAILREVGTTNRTHLRDYQAAVNEKTGAILSVHRSNFAMSGFVTSPDPADLGALAREVGVPYLFDVGSGLLTDLTSFGLTDEPLVSEIARQADLVVFSGDKLLGGPQAGCIVGDAASLGRCRKNPFARAMRADKLTLAALEATLTLYRDPARALAEIPVLAMLTLPPAELEVRARALAAQCPTILGASVRIGESAVGGGSFPSAKLATALVSIMPGAIGANALALKLRLGDPSIMVRIVDDVIVLDPRTLPVESFRDIANALEQALAE